MKNKKPIVALGALAVVGLVAGTIAYFTSQATFDNVFTTATYKTKSEEVFESPDNWTPGDTTTKTVTTKNEGDIPVAVRVGYHGQWFNDTYNPALTPDQQPASAKISDSVIEGIEAQLPTGEQLVTINLSQAHSSDWIASGGYYYYYQALAPDATTSSFMDSVTLNANAPILPDCVTDDTTTPGVITKTCTTTIKDLGKATYVLTITVETVQFDRYTEVWNGAPTIAPLS